MSADEIRNIALGTSADALQASTDGFVVLDDLVIRSALLAFSEMVERCEIERHIYNEAKSSCSQNEEWCNSHLELIDRIMKGATDERK